MGTVDRRKTSHGPSFLRWAGSKRKSLGLLSEAYEGGDKHYMEPFAGSAALFFSLQPTRATLGDLNGHLVNALRHVRDYPSKVWGRLHELERSADAYYVLRSRFNALKPYGLEAATLFIYLNRNCFNGLWRTNRAGMFNVPYGGTEMGSNPPLELFEECSRTLKKARLRHQDFRKTISEASANTFIYADPPYFTAGERTFVEYGKKSFGKDDLHDLITSLISAESRGAEIALTYNEAMPIVDIPKHWSRTRFEVTRNVGGFSGSRKKHAEVLYTTRPLKLSA